MTDATSDEIRRLLGQKLADLSRAGLTHWERSELPPASATSPAARSPTENAPDMARKRGEAASVPSKSSPTPTPASRKNATRTGDEPLTRLPGLDNASPAPNFPLKNLPLPERRAALEILSRTVAGCTRCPELAATRTQTVFGVGDPAARLLFLGEAPGADEDRLGVPFVGRSGQLLDRIITAMNLKREDIYICNILRCRPPNNRTPGPVEAANCREYLLGQLEIINPEFIVCWGSVAVKYLLERPESIGKLRGRVWEWGRTKVICTYHPAYLLRNPPAKKDTWDDMKLLLKAMGLPIPKTGGS